MKKKKPIKWVEIPCQFCGCESGTRIEFKASKTMQYMATCISCGGKPGYLQLISLIKDWRKNHEGQRFGQYLWNLLARESDKTADDLYVGDRLFYIEDKDLIKLIEKE